ncbi:MAG: creatininase family protein, partial [Thermotoga sp.]
MGRMWLTTENPAIVFEDTTVGRLKKKIWDASEEEIDNILEDYEIPSPPELAKPGSYIQTTVRQRVIENRRKNDIVFIPVGSTEKHGRHMNSGMDTMTVCMIAEAVRRYTAKQDRAVNLVWPPLTYGSHPFHHIGMAGTVNIPQEVTRELLIYVMLGLWNDGFRKQIIINNHGQLWVLEAALHEFMYRYQLPGVFQVLDWHRAVREFFGPNGKPNAMETEFIHAAEAETSIARLLFPEMVDMSLAQDTKTRGYLPNGHFDTSVEPFHRPHRWSEGEGQGPIELAAQPEGVVGRATLGDPKKARRPIAAIVKYLTLVNDQILDA